VLIQNGIDIELPVISTFPTNAVMSAVSMIGSRTSGENKVIQIGTDVLTIGPHFHDGLDRETQLERAREFVKIYTAGSKGAGAKTAECTLTEDMPVARWQKLLWNATFNTLCAMMRMNVGEFQSSGGRETLLMPAMREVYAIAKAAGHPPPEHMIEYYAYRLPDDCPYRPSMLLDLEHGRPMELEVVLGNPLKRAKEYNVPAPILSTVYELLNLEQWRMNQNKTAAP
jgi:2-dehydropantoate 2-reductase